MKEALTFAYNNTFPVLIHILAMNCFSIDNRKGNIIEFYDKNSFLSYCKRNLKKQTVNFISAGQTIEFTQGTII